MANALAAMVALASGCETPAVAPAPVAPQEEVAPALAPVKVVAAKPAGATKRVGATYDTPLQTDAELDRALHDSCTRAASVAKPLLVELSADWCADCRKLHGLKAQPPLREALAQWPHTIVNVGHFERHLALRKHWGVRSIAHWILLDSSQCDAPVLDWKVRAQRTLEPQTGKERGITAQELVEWLNAAG